MILYTFIDSLDDLEVLNKELLLKSNVGVDTEFRRTTKDNMRLALLQINDGEEIYLVDAIVIEDPKEHCSFLYSQSVVKIFHSCKEDLEAVYSWTKEIMVNIFDTQLANSFLDGSYSIGYQGLVNKKLGIDLDKNETRSNWIRRPLSDSQLKYAALDVEYLINLYEDQKLELLQSNKLGWLNEDIERLIYFTFNRSEEIEEPKRIVSKAEENSLLNEMNEFVEDIARKENINPTLFFSKKAQKDFLRLVLVLGIDEACKQITSWRKGLIRDDLFDLLK
ncbi:MAG: ribonuclease D [Flavobacteriaceae bacterium TMED238]|nr:MAG: ribonuclease D [Flavobacteriaceae bacterium TMED238]